jgi:hypothetical protein
MYFLSSIQCELVFAVVPSVTVQQPVYVSEAEVVAYRAFTLTWVSLVEVIPAHRDIYFGLEKVAAVFGLGVHLST